MSYSPVAVSIENLSKYYELYKNPLDKLKQLIVHEFGLSKLFGVKDQYYKEFWALRDISLEVRAGEILVVIGRNGAGKSTLLQLICGTLSPSEGCIKTRGRVTSMLELGSGFNPEFTGRENVYLNASILGLTRADLDAKLEEILAFADIGDFIDHPVKTYSSGMFMRLAFSVQAHLDPDILIIDEALAVGDTFFTHRCMARFHELKKKGVTILFVSHDCTAIKMLCDKALWIKDGILHKIGDASGVVDSYLAELSSMEINSSKSAVSPRSIDAISSQYLPTNKFGTQEIVIERAYISSKNLQPIDRVSTGQKLSLVIRLKNISLEGGAPLILGYSLRNIRGIDISSSNNLMEDTRILAPKINDYLDAVISFSLPHFHSGPYAFNISVSGYDQDGIIRCYEAGENAIQFTLESEKECHVMMTFDTEYKVIASHQKSFGLE